MMSLSRALVSLLSMTLLVSTLVLSGCKKQTPPTKELIRPVKSMVIEGKQSKILRSFPGKVLPNQQTDIAFQVPGKMDNIYYAKGQSVHKGDLLAELEASTYQDAVDRAAAKYRESLAQYNRARQLIQNNYISKSDFDKLRAQMEIAKANLSTAQTNLEYTKVTAPFDGVVARRFVERFDQVQAKQKIMAVHDISNVDVEVNIPENIVIYLKSLDARKDMPEEDIPRVYFESMPDVSYPLKLKEFTTEADVDTQTYAVRLTFPQPDAITVLPGMSVTVKALIPDVSGTPEDFFLIPSSCVFVNPHNEPSVWVVDPSTMRVSARLVRVTKLTGKRIRVLDGLKPGERVVTAGVHFIREGQQVKLLDLEAIQRAKDI